MASSRGISENRLVDPLPGSKIIPAVLLALGVLCLAAASVVFATVAWDRAPDALQVGIVVAASVGAASVAHHTHRRGLTGSAEALGVLAVLLGLVAVGAGEAKLFDAGPLVVWAIGICLVAGAACAVSRQIGLVASHGLAVLLAHVPAGLLVVDRLFDAPTPGGWLVLSVVLAFQSAVFAGMLVPPPGGGLRRRTLGESPAVVLVGMVSSGVSLALAAAIAVIEFQRAGHAVLGTAALVLSAAAVAALGTAIGRISAPAGTVNRRGTVREQVIDGVSGPAVGAALLLVLSPVSAMRDLFAGHAVVAVIAGTGVAVSASARLAASRRSGRGWSPSAKRRWWSVSVAGEVAGLLACAVVGVMALGAVVAGAAPLDQPWAVSPGTRFTALGSDARSPLSAGQLAVYVAVLAGLVAVRLVHPGNAGLGHLAGPVPGGERRAVSARDWFAVPIATAVLAGWLSSLALVWATDQPIGIAWALVAVAALSVLGPLHSVSSPMNRGVATAGAAVALLWSAAAPALTMVSLVGWAALAVRNGRRAGADGSAEQTLLWSSTAAIILLTLGFVLPLGVGHETTRAVSLDAAWIGVALMALALSIGCAVAGRRGCLTRRRVRGTVPCDVVSRRGATSNWSSHAHATVWRRMGVDTVAAMGATAAATALVERGQLWLAGLVLVGGASMAALRTTAGAEPPVAGALAVGWAAGAAAVLGNAVQPGLVEAESLPLAIIALALGVRFGHRRSSWVALGPGLILLVIPTLGAALAPGSTVRPLAAALVSAWLVLWGVRRGLAAPLAIGAVALGSLALHQLAPAAAQVPRWLLFGAIGVVLITVGANYERQIRGLLRAGRRLGTLR